VALVTLVAFTWLFVIGRLGWAVDVVAPHPQATLGALGRQLSMTQMWGEPTLTGRSFNPPGWSISAEWLAYLSFPLLALLFHRLRRLHPVVLLVLSCVVMLPLFLDSYLHGTRDVDVNWVLRIACCFAAGMLAHLATVGLDGRRRAEQWGLVLSVCSALGILLITFWAAWRATLQPGGDYAAVGTILYPLLVVGLTLSDRGPARLLSIPSLVYGGRISYSLYLVHFIVMDVVVTTVWQDESVRGTVPPGLALGIPAIVVGSVALAAATHRYVEEPARRLMLALLRRGKPVPARATAQPPATAEIPAAVLLERLQALRLPTGTADSDVGMGSRRSGSTAPGVPLRSDGPGSRGHRSVHRAS
jgi:peptidoglycan/LPS O-acetylase OafA/YrhL